MVRHRRSVARVRIKRCECLENEPDKMELTHRERDYAREGVGWLNIAAVISNASRSRP